MQEIVRKVIRLARAEHEEALARQKAYQPPGAPHQPPSLVEVCRDEARGFPARKALGSYLRALDEPTLRALQALMYAGRGDGELTAEFVAYMRQVTPTVAEAVENIASKSRLGDALERGLEEARRTGADLRRLGG